MDRRNSGRYIPLVDTPSPVRVDPALFPPSPSPSSSSSSSPPSAEAPASSSAAATTATTTTTEPATLRAPRGRPQNPRSAGADAHNAAVLAVRGLHTRARGRALYALAARAWANEVLPPPGTDPAASPGFVPYEFGPFYFFFAGGVAEAAVARQACELGVGGGAAGGEGAQGQGQGKGVRRRLFMEEIGEKGGKWKGKGKGEEKKRGDLDMDGLIPNARIRGWRLARREDALYPYPGLVRTRDGGAGAGAVEGTAWRCETQAHVAALCGYEAGDDAGDDEECGSRLEYCHVYFEKQEEGEGEGTTHWVIENARVFAYDPGREEEEEEEEEEEGAGGG